MNNKLYCINPNTNEYEEVKTIVGIDIEEIMDLIEDYKISKDLKFDKFGKLEEIENLKKINEEHKKLNGELRKENDALITVIDLAKNYMRENSKISLDDSVSIVHFYKDLLEILERVNEE